MSARYDYHSWDGSQEFANLDPEDLLAALGDDLLGNGDLSDAIERMLRGGIELPDGERIDGLRDLLEETRRRREELLSKGNPDGELAKYREALDEIEALERDGIEELADEAADSGDERRQEVTNDVVTERRMALDLMPADLAGRVSSMTGYEFVSSEAREKFEALLEEMREEIADTYFQGMSEALKNASAANPLTPPSRSSRRSTATCSREQKRLTISWNRWQSRWLPQKQCGNHSHLNSGLNCRALRNRC